MLHIVLQSPKCQMPGEVLSSEKIFSTTSTLKTAQTIGFGTCAKHICLGCLE